jgi:hypothetical protein
VHVLEKLPVLKILDYPATFIASLLSMIAPLFLLLIRLTGHNQSMLWPQISLIT